MIDPNRVQVHGQGDGDLPYPVRYHDEGYPAKGIDPRIRRLGTELTPPTRVRRGAG